MRLPVTADPVALARRRLRAATRWQGDSLATLHWWSDAELLPVLGAGLAGLRPGVEPTLVAGVQSSGFLLAPLVAVELGVGMLGIQKRPDDDGATLLATAEGVPGPQDRVLLVDDVVESGAQASAVRDLVESAGASWLGAAVMVSYRALPQLELAALFSIDELASH